MNYFTFKLEICRVIYLYLFFLYNYFDYLFIYLFICLIYFYFFFLSICRAQTMSRDHLRENRQRFGFQNSLGPRRFFKLLVFKLLRLKNIVFRHATALNLLPGMNLSSLAHSYVCITTFPTFFF